MPTIRNIAAHLLHVGHLGLHLDPGESVEVSKEQAALVAGHRLLEVTDSTKSVKAAPAAPIEEGVK